MKIDEILKTQNHMAFLKFYFEEQDLKSIKTNMNISQGIRTYTFDFENDWFFKVVYADSGIRIITLKSKEKDFDLVSRFFGLELDFNTIKTISSYVKQIICSGKL
jgi:hypothetical protein